MTGCPSNNSSDPIERENSGLKWSEAIWSPRSPPSAADHGSGYCSAYSYTAPSQ